MNEAIYRSPKWLRNIADFEVNTGDDIKGVPSKKRQKKLDFEESEKRRIAEEERLQKEYEKRQREREREYNKRQREKEENDERDRQRKIKFNEIFNSVIAYIKYHYKDCDISIPKDNQIYIKKNNLTSGAFNLEFTVLLQNEYNKPTFEVYMKYGYDEYNYNVSGYDYTEFKLFILQVVYPWYSTYGYKQSKSSGKSSDSGKSSSSSNYGSSKASEPKYKQSKPGETDEIKNKRRRYGLLKDTLEGYKRELERLMDFEKKNPKQSKEPEKEIVRNQITNVKDKINNMNKTYQFESLYYLKHLKSILS